MYRFLCGKQNRPPWGWRSSGKRQCRLMGERYCSGLSRKFAHQVMNGNDVLNFVGIGAAEDECVIHISFDSPDERHSNAIWRCAGIAGLKAVEAVSYVFTLFADPFYKGLRSARPGIWTGLWTIVTSSFFALTYICLNSSAASHSFVATKRVAICTPERPRER